MPKRGRYISPGEYEARFLEQRKRSTEAVRRARVRLAQNHPDEHRVLYDQAMREIRAERGPLPGGDEPLTRSESHA